MYIEKSKALYHESLWKHPWRRVRFVFEPTIYSAIPLRVNRKKKPAIIPPPLYAVKRQWFFLFTLTSPLFFLVLFEIILRTVHYGADLSLFTTEVLGSKTYHRMNPSVKDRYFSNVEFNPNTSPDYFAVPKPPGTFRIFCLGGSTTAGYPYGYVGSFSTFLRERLKKLFPEKSIEVINLGITATNSYTVLDLAKELVAYEPDMLCVYDGHNEFYGALGIASNESVAASRFLTNLYLRLIHFRSFILLRDLYGMLVRLFHGPADTEPAGTMMERLARGRYVGYGSETYSTALANFKANLDDLKSICTQRNIYLLAGSQVSNLRDQPPFISQDSPRWSQGERLHFQLTFNQGLSYLLNSQPDSALLAFDKAALLDPLRADVHFRRGCTLDSLKRMHEARIEYEKARDYDMLRFRASTDFNNAIREIQDGHRVFFVDVERAFRSHSPDSLIGSNLMLEHLHPNDYGYFLMAKEFTWPMRAHQIIADEETWNHRDHLDDDKLWSERPLTELDALCAKRRTDLLTSGWPFRSDTKELQPPSPDDTLETIVAEMVEGRLTWEEGHVTAATFLEGRGRFDRAEREYKALINQIPLNVSAYLILGRLYLKQEKKEEATAILLASTKVEETLFANRALGMLAFDPKDAIPFFEKALTLGLAVTEQTDVGYLLADAYHRDGKADRAIEQLQQVLRWTPGFAPAQQLLQEINAKRQ